MCCSPPLRKLFSLRLPFCLDGFLKKIHPGQVGGRRPRFTFWFTFFQSDMLPLLYPPHNSGGVLWFHVGHPCVCLSICRPSVVYLSVRFLFLDDNLSKLQWIFTKLVCALILWISGLELLTGKFRQIFKELSARDMPIFSIRTIT